jgi:hypothetical protein
LVCFEFLAGSKFLSICERAPLDGPDRSIKPRGQLAETSLPTPVKFSNRFPVLEAELCSGRSANALSFRTSVAHASTDTLGYQAALEFGDGTQHSKNHAARGRRRVDLLSETHKSYSQRVESFERTEQMRDAPGETVELPNHDDIEAPLMRVYHEPVKLRTPILRARYADVDVLGRRPAAALTVFGEIPDLHFRALTVVQS